MLFFPVAITINGYLTILLAVVAVVGDYLVLHAKLHLFQALFDNATHALIAALSWLIVCINVRSSFHTQKLFEIALCAGIASLIDVDHFVAAKSLSLKDATNLHNKRPPLHCSTLPFGLLLIGLLVSYVFQADLSKKVSLIVFTAFVSHHTRDATRRGYWFYPFGATPPIPYFVYIAITCFLPYVICFLQITFKGSSSYVGRESVI